MEHFLLIFGLLIAGAALLSTLLSLTRQSAIIAFIAVGAVAGVYREVVHIPHETIEIFTEIGIILLLFMAGLEVEFTSLKKRWRLLLGNATGQILSYVVMGALLGYWLLGISNTAAMIYFGLCLTFSSTIVVLGFLKAHRQMESLHGQVILGLMVLQDVTAVLSLVILSALSGEGSILGAVAVILIKLVLLIALLALLARYVLAKLFHYFAKQKELLFIGSLGWVLGVAALCEAVHFSPEIGAFLAGAALSFLPYRLEIQDKVEPMKDFGVVLFFLSLGYGLEFTRSVVSSLAPMFVVSLFVLFGTPIVMVIFGYINRLKSRPAFMIGTIVNQISEFSLILATLCRQAGIFSDRIFLLITLSTVTTIFLSSMGHQFLEKLYSLFRVPLSILDRHSLAKRQEELGGFKLEDHVVVIEYNELAEKVLDFFLDAGRRVLLIDIDPEVYDEMHGKHENLRCMYGDVFDPDVREDAAFHKAHAIISCLVDGQPAEIGILDWLQENGHDVPFLAATDSRKDALELYMHNATYVMQTEELAATRFHEILLEYGSSLRNLGALSDAHIESLKEASRKKTFQFT